MIDTFLSLFGLGYNYVSGIRQGKRIESVLNRVKSLNQKVEKLSENIYYAPSIRELSHPNQRFISNMREVRGYLEQLQNSSQNQLFSSSLVTTTDAIKKQFKKDPFDVLDYVRPYDRAKQHPNPSMLPIVFLDQNVKYVGWIMKGLLPTVFNIDYEAKLEYTTKAIPQSQPKEQSKPKFQSTPTLRIPEQPIRKKDTVFIEGEVYNTVQIGNQTWMAQSLNTKNHRRGKSSCYNYSDFYGSIHGRLYNWEAAIEIADRIKGWHLPTVEEWNVLVDYLGGETLAYNKMVFGGSSNLNFNLAGYRTIMHVGYGEVGLFWSSTKGGGNFWTTSEGGYHAVTCKLDSDIQKIEFFKMSLKNQSYVRLIRD